MRNFLIVLLVGGLAFLGYEFVRRNQGGSAANEREQQVPENPASDHTEKRVESAEKERRENAEKAPDPDSRVTLVGDAEPPAKTSGAGRPWVDALERQDFSDLELGADKREQLVLGSAGRFAFEVARARASSEALSKGDRAKLAEAAVAMRRTAGSAGTDALFASALQALSRAGKLDAAILALGGGNRFAAAPEATAAQADFLAAIGNVAPEQAVVALSRYVDALTRGRVGNVWRERFGLLRESYGALQKRLGRTVLRRGGSWRSRFHKVGRGDSLDRIANRFERELRIPMSAGLLQVVNQIRNPRRLRIGMRLRIPTDRIRVVIDKSTYSMKVFLGEVMIRLYEVGLGKEDCTPEAELAVAEKQYKPTWTHPDTGEQIPHGDPRHLIGDYFVALSHPDHDGYGLHGTADQESIGTDSSMGCVRMRADDMKAVFSYLPRRAKVLIRR